MKAHVDTLITFGGTAATGAKQFAEIANAVNDTDLQAQFMNMGMKVTDINDSIANYMKFQTMSGTSRRLTNEELKEGAVKFIEEQDRLAKFTGMNADQQNKAYEHALAQEQFHQRQVELQRRVDQGGPEAEQAKAELNRNRKLYLATVSKFGQGAADDLAMVLAGANKRPGYIKAQTAMPEAVEAIRNGSTDTADIFQKQVKGAVDVTKNFATSAQIGFASKMVGTYNDYVKGSAVKYQDFAEILDKTEEQQAEQKTGADDATRNMTKYTQKRRETIHKADELTNKGILPALKAYENMSSAISQLTGIPAEMLNKKGKIGGGPTAVDQFKSLIGGTPTSGSGNANARIAPTTSGTTTTTTTTTGTTTSGTAVPSSGPANISSYLQTAALLESGGNANAKAGTSSAAGLFQFTAGTWMETVKAMGKNYTVEDRFDPVKSTEVMEYFTNKQKSQLERATGKAASSTDLYLAHFLGAGGAGKFLNALNSDPNASAVSFDPRAAAANKSIFYDVSGKERSLLEVYNLMGAKVAKAENAVANNSWGGKALPDAVASLGERNTQIAANRNVPQAAWGSILSGPRTGFMAMLHGIEAVVPLQDGKTITVETSNEPESAELVNLLAARSDKMDRLVASMNTYMKTNNKLLQLQG
jgi:hypothetical protein